MLSNAYLRILALSAAYILFVNFYVLAYPWTLPNIAMALAGVAFLFGVPALWMRLVSPTAAHIAFIVLMFAYTMGVLDEIGIF